MTELLTAAQMRAIEQAAIDRGDITGLELMERAGRGVVNAIFEEWPDLAGTSHRAVVLCGPGNNGGDGFVIARLLMDWGWDVEVFLYGSPDKLPPDAKANYDRCVERIAVGSIAEFRQRAKTWSTDLVVDALFGTGLTRPIEDISDVLFNVDDAADLNADPDTDPSQFDAPRVVAVDLPSGLCSDSGRVLFPSHGGHAAASANLTVTFHREKLGHFLSSGPAHCGKLRRVSIGLEDRARPPAEVVTLATPDVHRLRKDSDTHKYTHGHALILSGGPGKTGAARLAARGALRIGAGLVTVGCPPDALAEVAHHQTAIMCRPLEEPDALREVLEDDRINALCLGPGLGTNTVDLTRTALSVNKASARRTTNRPTVLDADALTILADNPDLFDMLHDRFVLTPHGGEFKRLFPDIAERLDASATTGPAYSKVDAARDAATRARCIIVFKGPDTVIADQTGRCAVNASIYDRAAPWLATAGSGDVLAGFITGLLARGFPPMQAAETGAWLHTECALSFGLGLIAEDLPEELPCVFRRLFEGKS